MPKLKTNKSAAKRFKKTATGYKHRSSFRNHILTKKNSKRKARLASKNTVSKSDFKAVKRMLAD
ncbi:MAG: 50S ribosomal protein L35 [Gammaproteobacteria bacterium]|nr:50S ribosomal protein L35 [Gammaproteobacteria bacterium]